ncbi:mechanosensitive ion channel family protein [Parvularcula sp. IMCC14364]|uniref:mechanosensitive ion channel family protein n=1 Tax=Parvularcula sp. IMCC14364 TaxID=3067902 RepID=UPI002740A2D9|nr:mechanosensitive ion channel domain-containing protein [Parvularcula sp. IMCC14364]
MVFQQDQATSTSQVTPFMEKAQAFALGIVDQVTQWATSPAFYFQIAAIAIAFTLAWLANRLLLKRVPFFSAAPTEGKMLKTRQLVYEARGILFRILSVVFLGVAANVALTSGGQDWMVRIAQGFTAIWLIYAILNRFVSNKVIQNFVRWIGIPIAVLSVLGLLDDVSAYLGGISLPLGISALQLVQLGLFGVVFFWVGRRSNDEGKKLIQRQDGLDPGTKEVFTKLFEIVLFGVIFVVVLQSASIDLTALAVFGGALGVGLGFGLQQIAANFISGIIILLDRSITIGDYIELEDERSGFLTKLTMRSATLETPDGKDIMVPNEQFITTAFTNWTHKDPRQRYEVKFTVAYDTDLDSLIEVLMPVIITYPKVLTEPEEPDIEIEQFGEYGIHMLIEFWASGIDEGENKFTADLMMLVWRTLRDHHIAMPVIYRAVAANVAEPSK